MDSMIYRKKWPLIVFLTPALIFLTVFLFYPFLMNIFNSFFDMYDLSSPVNLEDFSFFNYTYMLIDDDMHIALINTLKMMGLSVVFQVGIALVLALMVDSITKGAQFFRTIFFFPIVISATAIGLMFILFYIPNGGVDQLLTLLGMDTGKLWLDEDIAFLMLSIPTIWQYVGFYFVILLTGLSSISDELYEAAHIDGATGFQRVRYISLPLLFNVLTTCLMLAITGSLKVFDMFWTILPNGVNGTFVTGTYMYFNTYTTQLVSYAAAIAVVIVLLGVVVAQICNLIFKPREY